MKRNKKGFTLVELLVVIVVLGLLIALAMPSIIDAMDNSAKNVFANQVIDFVNKTKSKYADMRMDEGAAAPTCYLVKGAKEGSQYEGYIEITQDVETSADVVGNIYVYNKEYLATVNGTEEFSTFVEKKAKAVDTMLKKMSATDLTSAQGVVAPTECVLLTTGEKPTP